MIKRAMPKYKNLVFVYGTLKRKEPNHHWISEKSESFQFLGRATTINKYPFVIASSFNIPYVLEKPGVGNQVIGELYSAKEEMLPHLDILEEHPKHYIRKQTPVKLISCPKDEALTSEEEELSAWLYFLPTFRDSILELPYITEYSSKGNHGLPYKEREDRTASLDYVKELH
uniref:Gamma-glutamylcyclotransferase family protein n=1 Tax=Caligus rogercresseyi TaxID=217165 RepID=C1BRS0_CALRO|nr:UPF0131 protein CG2811 [Caligus rogercresseyi]